MIKELRKYDNQETIELDVLGMSCIGCANSIITYLSKTEGVYSVDVNFASEIAAVDYNTKKISKDDIIGYIKKLGYDVVEDNDETSAEQKKKKQLKIHKFKIITSVFLSLIIIAISMKEHLSFLSFINLTYSQTLIILFMLSSLVVFWCGDRFLKGAVSALKNKTSDMNSLITLGVLTSYIYSIVISANHLFNLNIIALNNTHEVYYETAAMIITFILFGNYLEAVLKSKTQTSIKKLKDLQAKFVIVIRNGDEISIPYKKVKLNDIVIIKTGDKIPVDGVISEGVCVVDESAMTGESLPVEKKEGDKLISGTVLKNGFIKLKPEKVGKDTMLSKIINLVKEASNSKPKIQRLADKLSAVFVPLVIIIAVLTFTVWFFIVGDAFADSLLYAVAVLIIACPCALGLASPMAVVIGVGRAAENGILFNDVEAIEKMNKINTVCFDKTGTLTTGEMHVKDIKSFNGLSEEDMMRYAFSVEKYSNHPIAKSISNYCIEHNIEVLQDVKDLKNEDGMGISAVVNNKNVYIGNTNLLESKNIKINPSLHTDNRNQLFVSIDKQVVGIIEFEDNLKAESKDIVKQLKSRNFDLFMISGDNQKTTQNIADVLGIENYSYKTMPDEKEKIVSKLQSENKNVAMVGDGINDAPSLATANVGVAIGTGQDIAIESSDVILVKGDLRNLLKSITISGKTVRIIKQNIFWAFFYNVLAIPAAAGVFAPIGIVVSPVMAAMFMAFSDVITVVGNSLRLKYVNIDKF
ncbi:heavy metal translocating P-type ATPase [Bacteroidota bacterium]